MAFTKLLEDLNICSLAVTLLKHRQGIMKQRRHAPSYRTLNTYLSTLVFAIISVYSTFYFTNVLFYSLK